MQNQLNGQGVRRKDKCFIYTSAKGWFLQLTLRVIQGGKRNVLWTETHLKVGSKAFVSLT